MVDFIQSVTERLLSDSEGISSSCAIRFLSIKDEELCYLFTGANRIRSFFRGRKVDLCAITNAKSGLCPEDCSFCSQSDHYNTDTPTYPLLSVEELVSQAREALKWKAHRFCIVVSGRRVEREELECICKAISLIKHNFPVLKRDASLGELSEDMACQLKEAGLERYNHNLESTEDFFSKICTTHTWQDRLETVKTLKKIGIEVCCGGIFGLGETAQQRIEFAFKLKELDVNCIPLNFLNPIPGTPFGSNPAIPPLEILKTVAILRYILPTKQIRICGGRQRNLRSLQPMVFLAGADSMIIGNYLTTRGSPPEEDLQMIADLELEI